MILKKYKNLVIEILIFLTSIVLIYAGISKILDIRLFQIQMGKSPMLPEFSITFLSYFIPLIEILIAILLFIEKFRKFALYSSFILFLIFTLYLFVLNNFFVDVPCACGGILGDIGYNTHIIFNLFFTLVLILILIYYENNQ